MVILYFLFGVSTYTSYILLAKSCHRAEDALRFRYGVLLFSKTKSWHAQGVRICSCCNTAFNASDILIYITHEEQTGCVSCCQTATMQDSSRRRKAAISSDLKTFPYVAQWKTRTRLMSAFKDCLIGDASFSRCLANHGNWRLLELSHQKLKSQFQPLRHK